MIEYAFYALIAIAFCYALYRWANYEMAKTDKLIARINAEHGISLGEDFLGTISKGVLFDRDAQKFCVFFGRRRHEILDFSYIIAWRFEPGNRHKIVLETNDLGRPQLHIPILTVQDGKHWMAKLNILFNHT
ncbi:MAG: hypothetical protein V4723_07470 [Pseudomonadota bacterium]